MRIGLDIGGTKVAAVALGDDGDVMARSWHEHDARGIRDVAQALAETVRALPHADPAAAVGVSVSGLVRRDGTITSGASLDLQGDLAGELALDIPNPVRVFNDADATLRSVRESWHVQTGEELRDAVLLTVGTGVGGGVLVDGCPLRGGTGLAGELGHLPVFAPDEHPCVCGSSGCLEQYAGGKGIADLARRAIADGTASSALLGLHRSSDGGVTSRDVVSAARNGDPTSVHLLEQAARCIAQAIRALCVTVEPAVILLGGSVAHGASDFLPGRIEDHLHTHWPFAELTAPPAVHLDTVGPYAAAVGAAMLAAE